MSINKILTDINMLFTANQSSHKQKNIGNVIFLKEYMYRTLFPSKSFKPLRWQTTEAVTNGRPKFYCLVTKKHVNNLLYNIEMTRTQIRDLFDCKMCSLEMYR